MANSLEQQIRDWCSGKTKCPHRETVMGLAKDCLPCLLALVNEHVAGTLVQFRGAIGDRFAAREPSSGAWQEQWNNVKEVFDVWTPASAQQALAERDERTWRAAADELEKPYPEEIFTPLSERELVQIGAALRKSNVKAPSDRLHAQWARHWAKNLRALPKPAEASVSKKRG